MIPDMNEHYETKKKKLSIKAQQAKSFFLQISIFQFPLQKTKQKCKTKKINYNIS